MEEGASLNQKNRDLFIRVLNKSVILSVKLLAIVMVIVTWLSLLDVIIHLYNVIIYNRGSLFDVENLISTLGNILLVLIAIEIFLNIIFYLTKDAINVSLVLATALTAVARKVIILDYQSIEPLYIFALAAVILALGIAFLFSKKNHVSFIKGLD